MSQLPDDAEPILQAQVMHASVRRYSDDKLVVFHLAHKAEGVDFTLFANRDEEVKVAQISLSSMTDPTRRVRCSVVFAVGRFAYLSFSQRPTKLLMGGARCDSIRILVDPMVENRDTHTEGASPRGPHLSAIARQVRLSDVEPPVDRATRRRYLEGLNAAVPDDYEALLAETNGFRGGGWQFYGIRTRSVVLPDHELIFLAEDEDSQNALCILEGGSDPTVFDYNQVDDQLVPVGKVFIPELLARLTRSSQ